MAHPNNHEEIEKIRAYVTSVEVELNNLQIIPRTLIRYPFDTIALQLVSKAVALSRSCLSLLDSGFPDEACGLSRSLVELSLTLRYLTQDPETRDEQTDKFIRYTDADKAYWMYQVLQGAPDATMQQKIFDHAKELGIVPDAKSAFRHWSGEGNFSWYTFNIDHPLDGPNASELAKKQSYAVEYKHLSTFVHCTQPGLDNYIPKEESQFRVGTSSGEYVQPSQLTLFIVLRYLHCSITYALFGMNSYRPAALNTLFQQTFSSMKPIKRLHS
jgi:hypothetical protein